jgi:deazaflavin-dependent oxidoreductase (nitroreductase family)
MSDFNRQIIDEFRASGGRVGGPFEGVGILLLHTRGAKSGEPRVNPVAYRRDGDDLVIIASKAGAPTNPDWYHNLRANPVPTGEVGTDEFEVNARITGGAERQRCGRTRSGSCRASPSTSARRIVSSR